MAQAKKQKLIDVRLNKPNKFEVRREELAQSTLTTMGEKGYAKTSMRDIARDAGVSLGTIHYYFVDKSELLTYCMRHFKRAFTQRVIKLCEATTSLDELVTTFCEVCAESMISDTNEHRLWFDIRAQALYEPIFVPLRIEIEADLEEMFRVFIVAGEKFSGQKVSMEVDAIGLMIEYLFETQLFNYIQTGDADSAKRQLINDCRDLSNQLFHITG